MHAHWNGSDTWSVSPQVSGKPGKNPKFQLGVSEAKLGSEVQEATNIPCVCNEFVGEVMRGLRLHISRFLKGLEEHDMTRSQLGLAHSYSRAKVGLSVSIALSGLGIMLQGSVMPYAVPSVGACEGSAPKVGTAED